MSCRTVLCFNLASLEMRRIQEGMHIYHAQQPLSQVFVFLEFP